MTLIQDQDTPRRRRALWPAGFRIHPPIITTLIISTIVATAWRTGVFHHDLGLTTEYQYAYSGRQIQAGHWSTLFTNQLLTRNTFMCLSICLSVLVFVGFYEALAGSVRAIVVIVVTGIVGPLGVEAGLGLGNVLGSTWAANTLSTLDFGASAITAGGAGAVVALLRWRWLRIVALLVVLSGLPLHHQLADWEHLVATRRQALRDGTRFAPPFVDGTPVNVRMFALVRSGLRQCDVPPALLAPEPGSV